MNKRLSIILISWSVVSTVLMAVTLYYAINASQMAKAAEKSASNAASSAEDASMNANEAANVAKHASSNTEDIIQKIQDIERSLAFKGI